MKLPTLAIIDDELQPWLQAQLGEQVEMQVTAPELYRAESQPVEHLSLMVVQVDHKHREAAVPLIRQWADQQPQLTILAVAAQADSATILAAMRAGAADFILRGQDDDRIPVMVQRALQRGHEPKPGGCNVTALLAGHGDTGLAFLGEHLALAMAEQKRRDESILLLDLAMPAGAASLFMNLPNEYSARDAIADAYRCDLTLVNTAFAQHPGGPVVLSLPEDRPDAAAISADQIRSFLDVIVTLFNQVIICADAGSNSELALSVSEYANRGLIFGDQSILSSRHNQNMLRGMRAAGINLTHMGLVVDRYQKRVGLEAEKLAELLQIPLLAVLPGDPVNRLKAMNAGESLFATASGDEYPRAVRRLADLMHGRQQATPQKRSLLEKFLS